MTSNKKAWSKNRYAWTYAVLINVMIILFSVLLYFLQIYESAGFRALFLLFVLLGFVLMVRSYSKYNPSTRYLEAFMLCAKTGLYFLIIMLPLVFVFLLTDTDSVSLLQLRETYTDTNTIKELVFSLFFEMVAAIILSGICAAFMTGWDQNKSQ